MNRQNKTIHILGSEWKIRWAKDEDESRFGGGRYNAFTDHSVREIVMREVWDSKEDVASKDIIEREILRHEIIHAFLWESGLWANSNESDAWAQNEEMVDWFAIQHEKLHAAFEEAGALESLNKTIQEKMAELKEEEARIRLQAWETNVLNPCCRIFPKETSEGNAE